MSKEELKNKLKKLEIIHTEPVTLRSGVSSGFYCDIKKIFGYPDVLMTVVKELAKNVPKQVTCIAGSGHGGLPLATALSLETGLKFVLVRDKAKDHGKKSRLDGYIPSSKDIILIIDDVFTTGSSIRETLNSLHVTNASIAGALVVVMRGEAKDFPIPVNHLFDIEELTLGS